jgi:arylsulfatase A-like enzyme
MFTGYMPSQCGMIENETPLVDSLRNNTLGSLVADAGYDCAYAGKWHVNTLSIPDGEFGFRNIKDNGDISLAESCVKYLQERDKKEPFFLVASFINPHNICEYARGQKTPHAPVAEPSLEECPNLPENFAVSPYDASVLRFEQSQNYKLYPTTSYNPDQWRRYRNAYYRLTEAVDAEIGKILAEIDRQKLWKNTVIIFTSDHGDGNGAHQWNQKTARYEEVVGVPMIVCLPGGRNAGTVTDALVHNGIDLMPSICEWTGAQMPAGRRGVSYVDVAEKGASGQSFIVTETNFNQTAGTLGWMVRTERYKYVLYDKGQYREQLFDMTADRLEMRNLAVEAKFRDVLLEHRAILENWLKTTPGPERTRHLRFLPEN